MIKDIGIYLHIPFCKSKCFYCDFCSIESANDNTMEKYISAICKEILQNSELLSEYNITTIYIGGGTPSFVNTKYIKQILDLIYMFVVDKTALEITIELNPVDCTYEKLQDCLDMGINRFSLGIQSTNDEVLKLIGRRHNMLDVSKSLDNIRKSKINNVSLDVITGLPKDDMKSFKNTLNYILANQDIVRHISIYSLEVHENTKLSLLLDTGLVSLPDETEEREMYKLACSLLPSNGFELYEISNFAKSGFESKHNTNYWNQGLYLGFGASASSYINGKRYTNTSNVKEYINRVITNGNLIFESEEMDKMDMIREYTILKLRLTNGVYFKDFNKKFGQDIFSLFREEINKLKEKKLIMVTENNMYLTDKGRDLANLVWQEFI